MLIDGEVETNLKSTGSAAKSGILTKSNLIEEISRVLEIPRKEAAVIVEHILDSMVRAIDRDDKVEIRGFGSFRTRQRPARFGRNPKTGARVEVPAKRIPFFEPSKKHLHGANLRGANLCTLVALGPVIGMSKARTKSGSSSRTGMPPQSRGYSRNSRLAGIH